MATQITATLDLNYSPDEDCWYFQEFPEKGPGRVSVSYKTERDALNAYQADTISWEES